VKAELKAITPVMAERWINEFNNSNRKLREGVAEKYAADMLNGKWTKCPAPIAFYDDGQLADGQHRLWALVISGMTLEFVVVTGLSREDGLNIDTGLGRSLVDNARISGQSERLSNVLVSTARAIEFGSSNATAGKRALTFAETIEIVNAHREAALFAERVVKRKQGLCGATIYAAVGRAFEHGVDPTKLERFCQVLGTGLYEGDSETAAIILRNYLLSKNGTANATAMWRDTFLRAQRAIQAFVEGRRLTIIRAGEDEIYPPLTTRKPIKKAKQLKKAA
jgi:hypothetical protein